MITCKFNKINNLIFISIYLFILIVSHISDTSIFNFLVSFFSQFSKSLNSASINSLALSSLNLSFVLILLFPGVGVPLGVPE